MTYSCPRHPEVVLFGEGISEVARERLAELADRLRGLLMAEVLRIPRGERPRHCPKCDKWYYRSQCVTTP